MSKLTSRERYGKQLGIWFCGYPFQPKSECTWMKLPEKNACSDSVWNVTFFYLKLSWTFFCTFLYTNKFDCLFSNMLISCKLYDGSEEKL